VEEARNYLAKAVESLTSAHSDFAAARYNSCANWAYYACFQVAVAALLATGIRPASPRGEWSHEFVQSSAPLLTVLPPAARGLPLLLLQPPNCSRQRRGKIAFENPIRSLWTLRRSRYRRQRNTRYPVPSQGFRGWNLPPADKAELCSAHQQVDNANSYKKSAVFGQSFPCFL
jgi:hypothetical protein